MGHFFMILSKCNVWDSTTTNELMKATHLDCTYLSFAI